MCDASWDIYISGALSGLASCENCGLTTPEKFDIRTKETFGDTYVRCSDFTSENNSLTRQKIDMFCSVCFTYHKHLAAVVLRGGGCWECGKLQGAYNRLKIKSYDEFVELAQDIHGDVYDYSKIPRDTIFKSDVELTIVCKKHNRDFYQEVHCHIDKECGCPICSESHGEKIIRVWLEKRGISYEYDTRFDDCRNVYPLPFDFYILSFNALIEFDGKQHFEPSRFTFRGSKPIITEEDKIEAEENLKLNQLRDKIKTQYCVDKGIRLIRIPYTEIDNIEEILEKELLGKV